MHPAAIERTAAGALAAAVAVLPIVWALDGPQRLGFLIYPEQAAGLVLGLAAALIYVAGLAGATGWRRVANLVLAATALWIGLHIFLRFPVLAEGAFLHPDEALILGLGVAAVTLETLRRVAGWSLIVILGGLTLYALFSDLVPGRLQGRPIPFADILRFLGVDSTATLGAPLQVAAFVVVLFIFFGQLLVVTGGAEALTDAARSLAGDRRGATAKMAVIASGFMGSISGSAVSNVMSTGVITIPAMKRAGFRPATAGAIEAVASTGGQIMPPVMGAAAFLMAEFLRIPYQQVLLAALIPAALYFYAVYLQISLLSEKHALGAGDDEAAKPWRALLPHVAIVIVPMAVLLAGLFVFYVPPSKAVVWASVALILIGLAGFARRGRITARDVGGALLATGRGSAQILMVCAAAGMIIGLLSTSGLSFGLSFVLLELGEGSLLLLLIITAMVSILLGMGLPTTGVYLLLATLAAPPLVQLGVGEIEAHFFVLYFGLLSMITPPVALAAFAAASIAGAGAMRTAAEAVRFGWIAFILPFAFVYRPEMLLQGAIIDILLVALGAAVAVPLITAGIVGHGRRALGAGERMAAVALGAAAIVPLGDSGWAGAAGLFAALIGAGLIGWHLRTSAVSEPKRARPATDAPAP